MAKKKILVIDDEQDCCDLLKDYFVMQGYDVDIICDNKEIKAHLDTNIYEYIIFDYNMPCFSGLTLINILKEKASESKKILISGYDYLKDDVVKNMAIDAFLRKPFILADLKAQIEKL